MNNIQYSIVDDIATYKFADFKEINSENSDNIFSSLYQDFNKETFPKHVIFDMNKVNYISSMGYGYIVDLQSKLELAEKTLCLVGVCEDIAFAMELIKIDKLVDVFLDTPTAIKSIKST